MLSLRVGQTLRPSSGLLVAVGAAARAGESGIHVDDVNYGVERNAGRNMAGPVDEGDDPSAAVIERPFAKPSGLKD